jgi:hypothetical protein
MHSKDFHDNIDILEGFVFFDRSIDCRQPSCHRYDHKKTLNIIFEVKVYLKYLKKIKSDRNLHFSNKVNRHFHCTRPNCGYTFVRYSTMALHEQKHRDELGQHSVNSSMSSQLQSSPHQNHEAASPPPQSSSPMSGSSVSSGHRKIKMESPALSSQSDIAALKTGRTFF